ncbi:MAG: sigma-70 family RNA polymerase sigma factor [Bacteroidia bacterium]|nr:sigma-70 family RNA polymerase sigma factor [Bacteroidia bacterium]MDW8333063.1 sigma-70 family RNA polymerase sigma factor [Bacteroidia bacterium]
MKTFQFDDDHRLLLRFREGDASAFDELVRKHRVRLMEVVLRVTKDRSWAEDVFQDAWVRIHALLEAGKYRDEGKFLPWAVRIAKNMAIDAMRKRKRSNVERAPEGFENFVVAGETPEQIIVRVETRRDLRKLIAKLPKAQREVVFLRVYNCMSFKEIAAFTDCSINTALGRMRYAVENMRKQARRFSAAWG